MKKFIIALTLGLSGYAPFAHAVGIGDFLGNLMGRSGTQGRGITIDETLVKMSAQMNKKMPKTVDKETRLDRVSAEPGHHFIYHYTLTSLRSADINTGEFPKAIKPQLRTRLCESPEMQNFLKNGVTISYLYRSSDGHPIGGVKFPPNECDSKALASGQSQPQQ
jgi:hypothetical protein